MKIFSLQDDVFNRRITVIADCSYEELKKYIKRKHSETLDVKMEPDGLFFIAGRQAYLWVNKASNKGILFHEILHATFRVMDTMGVQLADESEETFCYYAMALYNKIDIKLKKWVKRKAVLKELPKKSSNKSQEEKKSTKGKR